MFIEGLLNRGSLPVLEQVMSFTQTRHEVLANNISNIDTVGYTMKDLPVEEFFTELHRAVTRRDGQAGNDSLELQSTRHLQWDSRGRLQASPMEIEDNNILFHDSNNRFVEKQMSEMSKNAMLHNVVSEILKVKYNGLRTAISGKL
ncbi:MAG: flagellar basal body rod protein FlgB [Sedimentisphaerales bacterium]|nr:flagellar basal body rod protein FlgB [Sedimentisphaerales bacterium]